jgi:hypothetical protein
MNCRSKAATTRSFASRNERASPQVAGGDLRTGGEQQRLVDGRLQLPHVALPLVRHAGSQRIAGQGLHRAPEAHRRVPEEPVDQRGNVLAPLDERGNGERDHAQPVVQILAEAPGAHRGLQVLVGGGEHAHVDPDRLVAADALDLPLLERAQQLRLRLERHVATFVEKQRAAVGGFELAFAARDRARERTLLVPEQLALHQLARERGTVHRDERLGATRAPVVQRIGDQLLAGPALAPDQHGHVRVGDPLDGLEHPPHGLARADHLLEPVGALHLLEQPAVIAAQQRGLHGAAHDDAQLVVVEGFGQVVGGAELHRLDGGLLRPVRGDHHHGDVRVDGAGPLEHLHAAGPLHAEIGDHDVEVPRLDAAHRFVARRGRLDLVALLREEPAQRYENGLLVVDDEDASRHVAHADGSGSVTWNSVPRPTALRASIVPVWASTIFLAIAMPRPVPCSLVVKNGLKMRSSFSGGIPAPLSRMRTVACRPPFSMKSSMRRPSATPSKASIALSRMLTNTPRSFSASACTVGPVM